MSNFQITNFLHTRNLGRDSYYWAKKNQWQKFTFWHALVHLHMPTSCTSRAQNHIKLGQPSFSKPPTTHRYDSRNWTQICHVRLPSSTATKCWFWLSQMLKGRKTVEQAKH